ncbi:MAG: alpha/beta hydrolase [Balneolaceae bacterium]
MKNQSNNFVFEGQNVSWQKIGNGKPLIILHGWGSSSAVMLPLAKSLESTHECYLIDFPGFGASPEPKEAWAVGDFAEMVRAFINQVIPGKKTDLLVHSYGGRVALKLLSTTSASTTIKKILITGGAGLKPKRKPSFYFKKYTAKTLKLPFLILPGSLRDRGLNYLRQTSIWKSLGSSDYQKLSGVMRETFVKSVSEYFDDVLPSIDHDILLLWGRDDYSTPLEQAKRLEKGLKNSALVVIDDADHYAFLDQPHKFTAIAKAFFEG